LVRAEGMVCKEWLPFGGMVKGTFIAFDFSWCCYTRCQIWLSSRNGYYRLHVCKVKHGNQIAAFTTLVTAAIPGTPGNYRIQATDGYKGNGLRFEDEKRWEKA